MYSYSENFGELSSWIRKEVEFRHDIRNGNRGTGVKRVQEWLNLHGFGIAIDSAFGPVTAHAVKRFQDTAGLRNSGVVNEETFLSLVDPMLSVLERRNQTASSPQNALLSYAESHLSQSPCEVGGQNMGPWVRLYMQGNEGESWPWCAGFVTFLLHQSTESLEMRMPIKGSFSCDSLAAQAREAGLFLSERDAVDVDINVGSFFLVRRTPTDWMHTGVVIDTHEVGFDTIEGNTNDDGHHEGYEVCSRSRGYANKDYVLVM